MAHTFIKDGLQCAPDRWTRDMTARLARDPIGIGHGDYDYIQPVKVAGRVKFATWSTKADASSHNQAAV